jgi:hypothetical protein
MIFRPTLSNAMILEIAKEQVANALLLDPASKPTVLAEAIIDRAEREFLEELNHGLDVKFYVGLINRQRRKESVRKNILRSLGFDHIPAIIIGARKRKVTTDRATSSDWDRYCEHLSGDHVRRKRNDKRLKEAQSIRDQMKKASKKTRGIRTGQVYGFDFGDVQQGLKIT